MIGKGQPCRKIKIVASPCNNKLINVRMQHIYIRMFVLQQEIMKMKIRRDTFTYHHHSNDHLNAGLMNASASESCE